MKTFLSYVVVAGVGGYLGFTHWGLAGGFIGFVVAIPVGIAVTGVFVFTIGSLIIHIVENYNDG